MAKRTTNRLRFLVLSDIHTNFHADLGKSFINSLPDKDIEGIIIAGDLENIPQNVKMLAKKYKKIFFVAGNHDYYYREIQETKNMLIGLQKTYKQFSWLNNSSEKYKGRTFVGSSLWYKWNEVAEKYMERLNDFTYIPNCAEFVKEENEKSVEFLKNNVSSGDIVITHHIPSKKIIDPQYRDNILNCYYYSDMDEIIKEKKPKCWIYGHTHTSYYGSLFDTQMFCNPHGYLGYEHNFLFKDLIIST